MEYKPINYFDPKKERSRAAKKVGIGLLIAGGAGTQIGVIIGGFLEPVGVGITMAVIGVCLLFAGILVMTLSVHSAYLSGFEYDNLVKHMVKSIGSNPVEYLGLDSSEISEIEPISFDGYKFTDCGRIRRDNKDYVWRSDIYEMVTIFFTQSEIHIYKAILNTLTSKITETTDVLFYDDVVSVSTQNESENIRNNTIDYISFNLVSKGGNKISIALNGNDNRQRSINAMRAMIKEKKVQ